MLNNMFLDAIRKPKTYREANFYAKMAVLESCSWIENCIDSIFKDVFQRELMVPGNISDFRQILDRNSGFDYKVNIRNKLSKNLIGIIHIERIENKLLRNQKFIDMRSALSNLKGTRNEYAHEHVSGSAVTVQTVSMTIVYFNQAFDGLKVFEKELKKIKFN